MSFIDSIKNFFSGDKSKRVYTHLDEKTLKENEIIADLKKKNSSLEAQIMHSLVKEKAKRDNVSEKKKENEFNRKLQEQKEELHARKRGKVIDLGKFYYMVFFGRKPPRDIYTAYSKWAKRLEICDKNDEIVLAKWGGFGITTGGKLAIIDDNKELMSYGRTLSHILHKPDAFENMARRGRFLIPMDKDGNWIEDIEYQEVPEPLSAEYDEKTGKIKLINWSKVKTSEVVKVIADKMELIHGLEEELESKESLLIKLNARVNDLNRTLNASSHKEEIAQSELSRNLGRFMQNEQAVGDMHIQITKLTEQMAMYKSLLDRKDEIIDRMMEKLTLTGEPKADLIKAEIQHDLQTYKKILPQTVQIIQEVPVEQKHSVQPGEVIKK